MASAAMLIAAPTLAQTAPAAATPQVTPPPVAVTTAPPSVTPPPAVRTAPETTQGSASPTRVNPEAAAQAAAEDAERRTARVAPRAAERPAPARVAAAPVVPPAPVAPAAEAAPAAQTQPAAASVVTPEPAAAVPVEQPAAEDPVPATEQTTATEEGPPIWPLALIVLLIIGAGAAWYMRARRREAAEDEAVYVAEPAHVAEPVRATAPAHVEPAPAARPARDAERALAEAAAAGVMLDDRIGERQPHVSADTVDSAVAETVIVSDAAPVAADGATVAPADKAEVAALAAADTPGDRPWLEFAMRPLRAGANVDEALVEIELTVANAGNLPAEDVRISTFMLPAGNDSEMERLLIERHDEAVRPITIAAGEGTRVEATLATSRAALVNGAESAAFRPVIVADARYRLPDGSEGRTYASFLVGGTPAEGTTLEPLSLDRPIVRDDVEAQLYREPARV